MFEWLTGTGGEYKKLPTVTPQQSNAINQLGNIGLSGIQGLNPSFEPIAQRAREQFGQVGIPSIAERFTSTGGGQRSSAFGQSLGQGASDLESQLAGLQSQHNLGQQDFFKQLLGLSLQPQFENVYKQANPGIAQYFGAGLGSALPGLATGGLSSLWGLLSGLGDQKDNTPTGLIKSQYNPINSNAGSLGSSYGKSPILSGARLMSGQGAMNQYGNIRPGLDFQSNPNSMVNMLRMLSGQGQ